jgi:hypothetical protein
MSQPYTAENLDRKLRQIFPSHDLRSAAESVLGGYSDKDERSTTRVRLAALKLAGDDIDKLAAYVKTASEDFRDVLAWAEYPNAMRLPPTGDSELPSYREATVADIEQYQAWLSGT